MAGAIWVKFSVLMSLYDKEQPEFLAKSLMSLTQQTLPADEVVLVWDGKINTGLQKVVEEFKPKLPLKIIALENNVGLGEALAIGLTHCQYDWIARFDSDDICEPNRFTKQIEFIINHPNIYVLGGKIIEFQQTIGKATHVRQVPIDHADILQYAKSRNPINHMTVMYQKSAVLGVGNYRHAPLYEDYDLWVRLLQAGYQFANLPEVLVYARAGDAMYARRGGFDYAKYEWHMQRRFYQQGFLTFTQFLKNLVVRLPIRLVPNVIRAWLYKTLLRQ